MCTGFSSPPGNFKEHKEGFQKNRNNRLDKDMDIVPMHTYVYTHANTRRWEIFRELGFVIMRPGNSKICRALAEPGRLTSQVRADL